MPHGNAWQANWCRCCSISDARNQSQASATVGISHFVRPSAATHTQIHMCAHMGSYAPIHTHAHSEKALKEKDEGNSSINTPVNIAVSGHSRLSHCLQAEGTRHKAAGCSPCTLSRGCGLGQKTTALVGCWQLAAAFNTRRMLPTDCQPQLMCASVKFKLTASKSHLKLRAWIFGRHAVASSEALLLSARVRGQLEGKASGKSYSRAHTTVIYPVLPSIEHPLYSSTCTHTHTHMDPSI